MLIREKKVVAALMAAVKHVERSLSNRDEYSPNDWRYKQALEVLQMAREEAENKLQITNADQ